MRSRFKLLSVLVLLSVIGAMSMLVAQGQSGNTIMAAAKSEGQLDTFINNIYAANLGEMYNGHGPFTVFAPTDAAFAALPSEVINSLKADPNQMRQSMLYHTLRGDYTAQDVSTMGSAETGLGRNITVSIQNANVIINNGATVIVKNIKATNGTIHVIDAVLDKETSGVLGGWGGSTTETGQAAPPPASNAHLADPSANPAFEGSGQISYWAGIARESASCKGMTWTLLEQRGGVSHVGADAATNPYRGDTDCNKSRPMLCMLRDHSTPPSNEFAHGWAHGQVKLTSYIQGTQLTSTDAANGICEANFGAGWRVAEFHDGGMGAYPGDASGWHFWAFGGIPLGTRFWVSISDQPANPWNSVQERWGPNYHTEREIVDPSQNPSFVPGGIQENYQQQAAGRPWCKGMTWVVQQQYEGMVLVGADNSTNAIHGDRSCPESFPIVCIKVDGIAAPGNTRGNDYSINWAGGHVAASYPVTGDQITTREAANNVCKNSFGEAWRMAEFHDGSLGTGAGIKGWQFWAYGNLPIGTRLWVAINDQPANPWNH